MFRKDLYKGMQNIRILFRQDVFYIINDKTYVFLLDKDECKNRNGGCNQICLNKAGAFECSCKPGYQLAKNKKTCIGNWFCSRLLLCINNKTIFLYNKMLVKTAGYNRSNRLSNHTIHIS